MRKIVSRLMQFSVALAMALVVNEGFARPVEPVVDKNVDKNKDETVQVRMETSKGTIVLRLYEKRAPQTVKNFLFYVDKGFYNNLIFHRVIDGFMVQGGGFNQDMSQQPTGSPVYNESSNGLPNKRGTIAMARTSDPHSATSQFYINLVDNNSLNYRAGQPGYTVFGEVVEGLEAVDAIAKVRTGFKAGHRDVPVEPVLIVKTERVKAEQAGKASE